MSNIFGVFDSNQAAHTLGTTRSALYMWLSRNPEYRPKQRFSGDDLVWTAEEIEKVREARANRKTSKK